MELEGFGSRLEYYCSKYGVPLADIQVIFGQRSCQSSGNEKKNYHPKDEETLQLLDTIFESEADRKFIIYGDESTVQRAIFAERVANIKKHIELSPAELLWTWRERRAFTHTTLSRKIENVSPEYIRDMEAGVIVDDINFSKVLGALPLIPYLHKNAIHRLQCSKPQCTEQEIKSAKVNHLIENLKTALMPDLQRQVEDIHHVVAEYDAGMLAAADNFSEALNYLLDNTGTIAADVSRVLGLAPNTVNGWRELEKSSGPSDSISLGLIDELFMIPECYSCRRFERPVLERHAKFGPKRQEAYREFFLKPLPVALWYWREERKYVQSGVGNRANLSAETIRDIEYGKYIPTQGELHNILSVLKILPGLRKEYHRMLHDMQLRTSGSIDPQVVLEELADLSNGNVRSQNQDAQHDTLHEFLIAFNGLKAAIEPILYGSSDDRDQLRKCLSYQDLMGLSEKIFAVRDEEALVRAKSNWRRI